MWGFITVYSTLVLVPQTKKTLGPPCRGHRRIRCWENGFDKTSGQVYSFHGFGLTRGQFMKQDFVKNPIPSINMDVYHKSVVIDEVACTVGVLEMTGLTPQNSHQNVILSDSDAFILVFSRQNRSSFRNISSLHTRITGLKKNVLHPVVLIGLDHGDASKLGEREVLHKEGVDLAEGLRCSFIQCPARSVDVDIVFFKLSDLLGLAKWQLRSKQCTNDSLHI